MNTSEDHYWSTHRWLLLFIIAIELSMVVAIELSMVVAIELSMVVVHHIGLFY